MYLNSNTTAKGGDPEEIFPGLNRVCTVLHFFLYFFFFDKFPNIAIQVCIPLADKANPYKLMYRYVQSIPNSRYLKVKVQSQTTDISK